MVMRVSRCISLPTSVLGPVYMPGPAISKVVLYCAVLVRILAPTRSQGWRSRYVLGADMHTYIRVRYIPYFRSKHVLVDGELFKSSCSTACVMLAVALQCKLHGSSGNSAHTALARVRDDAHSRRVLEIPTLSIHGLCNCNVADSAVNACDYMQREADCMQCCPPAMPT